MANTVKPQPQPLSSRTVAAEDDNNTLENIQAFYETHKKTISTAFTVVVVLIAAVVGYLYLYKAPREKKAAGKAFFAQQYFMADSVEKALQGDGQHYGFLKVIREYSGTQTANLSHYYAGLCYLKIGNFKQAIKQLDDFDGKGTMIGTAAHAKLGDAYMETGDVKKAVGEYEKATENKNDIVQTPMYLYSLGMAYEQNRQPEDAKKAYMRIRDEYPSSMQARDIDKNLARLGEID